MPMQRTFTLIPNSPAPHPAQHARPMTTKQVRKAYKASTKTPPISRAEQKKQERAEQERIRREFEKEKAAARAKLAREKKRERELAEREQKKKLGMPLVTVRPSQDTIARFIRGNGSGKKRNFGGETLEEAGKEKDAVEDTKSEAGINHDRPELDLIPEEDERELEEFLDTITNSISAGEAQRKAHVEQDTKPQAKHQLEQQSPPTPPPHKEPNHKPKSPSRPMREMKPPPRPPQAKPPQPVPSPPPAIQQPPMSTQAILGNLDDFFPSSSQQALELQDETLDNIPSDSFSEMESPTRQKHQPPQRFFTSSGSNELISLAIQRSKRTAAMEELKDQHQEIAQAQHPKETTACKRPDDSKINTILPPKRIASITKPRPSLGDDKENIQTDTPIQTCAISDSQETEYGGDWMDELASDLIV